jgi:hypothetical protein
MFSQKQMVSILCQQVRVSHWTPFVMEIEDSSYFPQMRNSLQVQVGHKLALSPGSDEWLDGLADEALGLALLGLAHNPGRMEKTWLKINTYIRE